MIQCGWASKNQVGPVDLRRILARGPVPKNPNVAACQNLQTHSSIGRKRQELERVGKPQEH